MTDNRNRMINAEDLSYMNPDMGITHVGVADVPKHASPAANTSEREWTETCKSGDWTRIAAGFKTNSPAPVSHAYLEEVVLTIAKAYHDAAARIDALEARLCAKSIGPPGVTTIDPAYVQFTREDRWLLERDVDELKRTALRGGEVHQAGKTYERNSVVTIKHRFWRSTSKTDETPGEGQTSWEMWGRDTPSERAK
jgi:hypothetical protein